MPRLRQEFCSSSCGFLWDSLIDLKLDLEPASVLLYLLRAARSRCSSSAPFRLMQARASRWNKLRTSSLWWRVYRLQVDQTMWHGSLQESVYKFLHRSQKNAARGRGEGNSSSSDTRRRARAETEETEAPTWKLWPAWSREAKCKRLVVTLAGSVEQDDCSHGKHKG